MTPKPKRLMTAFRIDADKLAEITKRADAHGMTRTDYMIAASLGELNAPNRLDEIEERLTRLEEKS
jgi:uncharacterized protein (DUF1778 family)